VGFAGVTKINSRRNILNISMLHHIEHAWHARCLMDVQTYKWMSGLLKSFRESNQPKPTTQPNQINMSQETNKPESISDEQLEDVAGGVFDNNNCGAAIEATVIVG
jgi:hypothetical protein